MNHQPLCLSVLVLLVVDSYSVRLSRRDFHISALLSRFVQLNETLYSPSVALREVLHLNSSFNQSVVLDSFQISGPVEFRKSCELFFLKYLMLSDRKKCTRVSCPLLKSLCAYKIICEIVREQAKQGIAILRQCGDSVNQVIQSEFTQCTAIQQSLIH